MMRKRLAIKTHWLQRKIRPFLNLAAKTREIIWCTNVILSFDEFFFNWILIFFPGAESDGEKKVGNYEPIDYEEELDLS